MEKIIIILIALFSCLSLSSQVTVSYQYDRQGRLTSETYDSVYQIQLSYDKEGNFTSKSVENFLETHITDKAAKVANFLLYPNPAEENVYIEANNTIIYELGIYDLTGRKLKVMEQPGNYIQIAIDDLVSGIYLVKIKSEGEPVILKFIKK